MKKKIVFASHDPGGCNLLIPIIKVLSNNPNYTIYLLLAGPAKEKAMRLFSSFGEWHIELNTFPIENFPNEYDVHSFEINFILDDIKPDILFTSTSINSNIERYVIQYGKMSDVPTISYIDSWLGDDIRFCSNKINVCPNYILVCDEQMRVSYLKYESEYCKVMMVGNIHLEMLARDNTLGNNSIELNRILFFSENIFHYYPDEGFNEILVLQKILDAYQHQRQLDIVIRPHPLESKSHWIRFIEKVEGENEYIKLSLDNTINFKESILKSALTFGVSSMALIEASMIGKYTFSFQVGIKGNKKFLYIPFEEYGINSLSSIRDVCRELSIAGTQTSGYIGNHKSITFDRIMMLFSEI